MIELLALAGTMACWVLAGRWVQHDAACWQYWVLAAAGIGCAELALWAAERGR